jgi:hypothetical protein
MNTQIGHQQRNLAGPSHKQTEQGRMEKNRRANKEDRDHSLQSQL